MALFFLLILLLAIAWGLADYQLQGRIDSEPAVTSQKKSAPATKPEPPLPPPALAAPGSEGPADTSTPASPGADAADTPAVPPATEPAKN